MNPSVHRIVSLIPSATEIVAALGYTDQIVGRSHECDYPARVSEATVCSEPKINVHGASREIDLDVRAAVEEALSVYRVFADQLEQLRPTTVITQTQCDICAVNLRDVEAAVRTFVGTKPQIASLEPMCLADIQNDIMRVAVCLGERARGTALNSRLSRRFREISHAAASPERRLRVVCVEWLDPLMAAGNWIPELVEIAGGIPLLCEAGKHSPWLSWEQLCDADPDVIVIMPCGFNICRTLGESNLLTEHPLWSHLRAVQQQRVYVTDGNQYFNRPGPRVVESAEILYEILHSAPNPRLRGTGWRTFM